MQANLPRASSSDCSLSTSNCISWFDLFRICSIRSDRNWFSIASRDSCRLALLWAPTKTRQHHTNTCCSQRTTMPTILQVALMLAFASVSKALTFMHYSTRVYYSTAKHVSRLHLKCHWEHQQPSQIKQWSTKQIGLPMLYKYTLKGAASPTKHRVPRLLTFYVTMVLN